jgi:hypothetical protein
LVPYPLILSKKIIFLPLNLCEHGKQMKILNDCVGFLDKQVETPLRGKGGLSAFICCRSQNDRIFVILKSLSPKLEEIFSALKDQTEESNFDLTVF